MLIDFITEIGKTLSKLRANYKHFEAQKFKHKSYNNNGSCFFQKLAYKRMAWNIGTTLIILHQWDTKGCV